MRHNRRLAAIGSAVGAAALAFAVIPGQATADDSLADRADAAAEQLPTGMLEAMERDLDLSTAEATNRIVAEQDATALSDELSAGLSSFAGSWLADDAGTLVVATSDAAEATAVEEAGATVEVVDHSLAELESVKERLDAASETHTTTASPVWYVDVTANEVVLLTSDTTEAASFVEASGVEQDTVRVVESSEQPQTYNDLVGGDAYYIDGLGRCSVGFSVTQDGTEGFATAGHCGSVGSSTAGHNQVDQGTFEGSIFPGSDKAWVSVNDNWNATPTVNSDSGAVTVAGSEEAPVGAAICRSGSTTGWHCGEIEQHNTSVTYPEGTINGVTRTSVCAEPGDSGGAYISGDQAQGVTSGGSGNCSLGGTTYHQPINPILDEWNLELVTG